MTVTNTFANPSERWRPAGMVLSAKHGQYYLAAECRAAKAHARAVYEAERAGRIGAWKCWQDFVDQWHIDSLERAWLNLCFDVALTDCHAQPEYDPAMPDAG